MKTFKKLIFMNTKKMVLKKLSNCLVTTVFLTKFSFCGVIVVYSLNYSFVWFWRIALKAASTKGSLFSHIRVPQNANRCRTSTHTYTLLLPSYDILCIFSLVRLRHRPGTKFSRGRGRDQVESAGAGINRDFEMLPGPGPRPGLATMCRGRGRDFFTLIL